MSRDQSTRPSLRLCSPSPQSDTYSIFMTILRRYRQILSHPEVTDEEEPSDNLL